MLCSFFSNRLALRIISFLTVWPALTFAQAPPLALYLQEGFNAPGIPAGWIVTPVSGGSAVWSVVAVGTNPPIAPYAGSGQAKFNSYDADPGHQSRLTSLNLNMGGSNDPFLSFSLYHDDEFLSSRDSLYIEATTGDSIAGPWVQLAGNQRPRSTSGWSREILSLNQYNGVTRLYLSFRGRSQYGNNIYLDEIRVADSSFHDIGTAGLLSSTDILTLSPASNRSRLQHPGFKSTTTKAEEFTVMHSSSTAPLNISFIAQNFGTFSEPSYQVQWEVDGQGQPAVNNAQLLPRNGRDTLTLSWLAPSPGTHVITARTFLSTDPNSANDSTRLAVAVLDSSVTFSEMFNSGAFPPSGWTVINRDGGSLLPWFLGSSTSVFLPFEGTGFAANNFQRANGTYIDDYIISPAIAGVAQTGRVDSLGFWVRSAFNVPPEANYPDSLMILLSTTGSDTSNFNILLDYLSVPKTGWTLRRYSLTGRVPTNSTIRVAFRYLHYNGGSSGSASDFVGVDFVHITSGLPTTIGDPVRLPTAFALHQNYPNPFNPSTEIEFSVDATGQTRLEVFNVLGQTIATMFDEIAHVGRMYRVRFNAANVAGGVYFCRLQSGGRRELTKMALIK